MEKAYTIRSYSVGMLKKKALKKNLKIKKTANTNTKKPKETNKTHTHTPKKFDVNGKLELRKNLPCFYWDIVDVISTFAFMRLLLKQ